VLVAHGEAIRTSLLDILDFAAWESEILWVLLLVAQDAGKGTVPLVLVNTSVVVSMDAVKVCYVSVEKPGSKLPRR
jgi:hypothetical protein